MKKYFFVSLLALALVFCFASPKVFADVQCPNVVTCPSNGMPIPNPTGWIVVAPGVDGCPAWYPFAGCVIPPSAFTQYGLNK